MSKKQTRKTKTFLNPLKYAEMIEIARGGGIDIYELAETFDISVSTLRKHLHAAEVEVRRNITIASPALEKTEVAIPAPVSPSTEQIAGWHAELQNALMAAERAASKLGLRVYVTSA